MSEKSTIKYILGIDEVGRGPVAGPVAVGGFMYAVDDEQELEGKLPGMTDSKKLSEKKRQNFFKEIKRLKEDGVVLSAVVFVSAGDIDTFGIVPSIQKALNSVLENILESPGLEDITKKQVRVLLDGGLHAPEDFTCQETIIRGDQKEFSISCASVVSKVIRDKKMKEYGNQFPQYYFEQHKGYGTKKHIESIQKHGLCPLHRKSFLKEYV